MRLCLVEDTASARLEPLVLTRPVHDLLLGGTTLGDKIARAFQIGPGPARRGLVIRPTLAAMVRERDPHTAVNDSTWLARDRVLVVNSRWIPPDDLVTPEQGAGWVGLCDDQPVAAWVHPDDAVELDPHAVDSWFEAIRGRLPVHELGGKLISYPWDLVNLNSREIVRDFQAQGGTRVTNRQLADLALVGPADRLRIHDSVRIDPYTVFDTTSGPITVEAGVVVQPFTRIEGPCHVGRDTQLFRANLRGGVSIGPNCRIGGEVEHSIIIGHSNKYHEGFLGHAYVGEWVNLGAITSNSDLRNDYGEVMVPLGGDPVPTGHAKVGCFLGDHTRTGLGSMINTGTVVGVMCNLLPAGPLLPKHVPSFTAVRYGRVAPGFPLEEMFATARTVKGRRGLTFTQAEEQLFRDLYEQTKLERKRAFQRAGERSADAWPSSSFGG